MDILILAVMIGILLAFSILNKRFTFLGVLAGLGILMLALLILIDPIETMTGLNVTVNTTANLTVETNLYTPIISWMNSLFSLILAGVGLLITIRSIIE